MVPLAMRARTRTNKTWKFSTGKVSESTRITMRVPRRNELKRHGIATELEDEPRASTE